MQRTQISVGNRRGESRIRRGPADFALLFGLLFIFALVLAALGLQYWYAERVYPGITVAGVPVGGMTRAEAVDRLNRTLVRQPLPPMLVTYGDREWPVAAGQANAAIDVVNVVNEAYLVGRRGDMAMRLSQQLSAALGDVEVSSPVKLDVPQLRYAVSQIASDVRIPARPGVVVADVRIPPQPGIDVDVDATLAGLITALETQSDGSPIVAPLAVLHLEPPPEPIISLPDQAQPVAGVLAESLILRNNRFGYEFAIDPASLEEMVYSKQPLRLDDDQVRSVLNDWATQIDREPVDARLRFDAGLGTVQVVQDSQAGRKLDVEATLDSVREAVDSGSMAATLVIRDLLPAVDSSNVAQMGIQELVASGTTYFAGSSLARVRNIEVAAEKFDGVVIPPNGVFSFNENVEDVTSANGFEDSLIIWGDRTAVGVGGGVCQVSTTVFRAAYAAGFPIVERYNHGYVVSWYGEPGLDATIYTPSVDFRFRNDTGAYLLLEPVVDSAGGTITFNFYGTKPERVVSIGEPVITDVIEPAEPIYRFDESLGYGEKKQVDWEQDGMVAAVTRTIIENGETRTETLNSKYQPWQAVYLYGPGADVPVTPTVVPRSDAEGDAVDVISGSAISDTNTSSPEDSAIDATPAAEAGASVEEEVSLPTPTPTPAAAATATPEPGI